MTEPMHGRDSAPADKVLMTQLGDDRGVYLEVWADEYEFELRLTNRAKAITFAKAGARALSDELLDWLQTPRPRGGQPWDTAAIAEHFNVDAGTVRNRWVKHPKFPAPIAELAVGRVWNSSAVNRWARLYRRGPGRPPKVQPPRAA